jgi:L-threonylcarbamoyladenylate synthase
MPVTALRPTPEAIRQAAAALGDGRLVILPTDTVYGVCADALNDDAVRDLYAAKGKEPAVPLQLLFAPDMAEMGRFALLTPALRELVEALGPGGWTIIVPAAPGWRSPALAGGTTVGFRIPDSTVLHEVIRALGHPLAASSANRHGGRSPTTCAAAVEQIGEACAIAIDGGPTAAGLDSTVIDLSRASSPRILREGAIDRQTVARILGVSEIEVLRSVRP